MELHGNQVQARPACTWATTTLERLPCSRVKLTTGVCSGKQRVRAEQHVAASNIGLSRAGMPRHEDQTLAAPCTAAFMFRSQHVTPSSCCPKRSRCASPMRPKPAAGGA